MASALVDVRDPGLDRPLLWTVALLALAGLVIVTSASLQIAETRLDSPFHYGLRHGI
ncbi:MAG TPA: cell division protein FtsW, partial [Alcanivorax sp.]|nr:cell division protein FtsW [Alcanivorax sp.]